MANGELTLGMVRGLNRGVRQYKADKRDDEDRLAQQEDRADRKSELGYVRERRKVGDAREDAQYEQGLADSTVARERNNTQWNQSQEDRTSNQTELAHARKRRDVTESRTDIQWHQSQETMQKKLQEEGMHHFLDAIEKNVDPNMAVNYFNKQGQFKIKPGTVKYDKKSGALSFIGDGGQQYNGTIQQLRSLTGGGTGAPPAIKMGKDDRLVDPRTFKTLVPAASEGAGGSSEKRSPFNFQTYSNQASNVVKEAMGAKFDNTMQQWQIPEGMSQKVAFAQGLSGQVARHFDGKITAQEVGALVMEVAKDVPTYKEAHAQAMREVTSGDQKAISTRAAEIMDGSRVTAAQNLKSLMEKTENNLTLRGQQQEFSDTPPAEDGAQEAPPAEMLKEGFEQEFDNGQVWTLQNGRAVRVR